MYSFNPQELEYIKQHLENPKETFLWYHQLEKDVTVPVEDLEEFVMAVVHNH